MENAAIKACQSALVDAIEALEAAMQHTSKAADALTATSQVWRADVLVRIFHGCIDIHQFQRSVDAFMQDITVPDVKLEPTFTRP